MQHGNELLRCNTTVWNRPRVCENAENKKAVGTALHYFHQWKQLLQLKLHL